VGLKKGCPDRRLYRRMGWSGQMIGEKIGRWEHDDTFEIRNIVLGAVNRS
jgi:hypothetical protein